MPSARHQASLTPRPAAAKVWQQLVFFSIPSLTLSLALILEQTMHLPTPLGLLSPPWLLLTCFYWLGHRPQALAAPLLLLIGILHDILRAWPVLGITALLLLLLGQALRSLDHWLRTQPFRYTWALAVICAISAEIFTQLMLWIFSQQHLQPLLWLWAGCSAGGLYPLLGWLLHHIQRITIFRRRQA